MVPSKRLSATQGSHPKPYQHTHPPTISTWAISTSNGLPVADLLHLSEIPALLNWRTPVYYPGSSIHLTYQQDSAISTIQPSAQFNLDYFSTTHNSNISKPQPSAQLNLRHSSILSIDYIPKRFNSTCKHLLTGAVTIFRGSIGRHSPRHSEFCSMGGAES